MQYAVTEDVITVQKYFKESEFKHALLHANPGVMDSRSWAYWNLKYFHTNKCPKPTRFSPFSS
jgi:hypothetical protein